MCSLVSSHRTAQPRAVMCCAAATHLELGLQLLLHVHLLVHGLLDQQLPLAVLLGARLDLGGRLRAKVELWWRDVASYLRCTQERPSLIPGRQYILDSRR